MAGEHTQDAMIFDTSNLALGVNNTSVMDLKRLNDDDIPNRDLLQKTQLYMQEREGDRFG